MKLTTLVSMLRDVNVAGHRMLKMSELTGLYASLCFENIRTYLQSGNVVFSQEHGDFSDVGRRIESELKSRLGLDVSVFIRTPKELEKIVAGNPFIKKEHSRLQVTFLQSKPTQTPIDKLNDVRAGGEEFKVSGKEVFLFLPNGSGRTKLSNAFLEKTFGLPATTRNWNTVTSLFEMIGKYAR